MRKVTLTGKRSQGKKRFVLFLLWIVLVLSPGRLRSATFTVTNSNDTGAGSLRDAITLANTTGGQDTIIFNIQGTGPHSIFPLSQLPQLGDPSGVIIDGLSQPGASAGSNPPSMHTITLLRKISYPGIMLRELEFPAVRPEMFTIIWFWRTISALT